MKTGWMKFGTVCVVLVAGAAARGEITFHNGSSSSFPVGSGDVDVDIDANPDLSGELFKDYFESATLELTYGFESGQPPVVISEVVSNLTPESWSAFTITLELARFFKAGEGAITPLSGDITIGDMDLRHADGTIFLASELATPMSVTTSGDVTTLFIDFASPLVSNDFFESGFQLRYDIGVNCITGPQCGTSFIMTETPTPVVFIPAPGAALLGVIGLGFVGRLRRRNA